MHLPTGCPEGASAAEGISFLFLCAKSCAYSPALEKPFIKLQAHIFHLQTHHGEDLRLVAFSLAIALARDALEW